VLVQKLIFIGVLILGAAVPVLACTCVAPDADDSLSRSDVAFFGTLVEVAHPNPSKINFEVHNSLKGTAFGRIEVDTSHACDSDMFLMGTGRTYLVYAKKTQGKLILPSCSGTRQFAEIFTVSNCTGLYPHRRSFLETAAITAICVSLSLSVGCLVTYLRKRKR
jgi:hypothetical protein